MESCIFGIGIGAMVGCVVVVWMAVWMVDGWL